MSLTHPDRLDVLGVHQHDDHQRALDETSPTPDQSASTRPTFTITDAAAACAVSRKTITRKLPELAGHGAAKDDDGVWRIPVEALLAVGLRPGRSLPESTPVPARPVVAPARGAPDVAQDTITIARDRWDDLRIRLARAEAEASERALALADARLALRALTAGPASAAPVPAGGPAASAAPDRTSPRDREAGTVRAPSASTTAMTSAGAAPMEARAMPGGDSPGGDSGARSPEATRSAAQGPQGVGQPRPGAADPPVDVSAARAHAAQTGGHIPAGSTTVKKRRWWQSAR